MSLGDKGEEEQGRERYRVGDLPPGVLRAGGVFPK